MKERQQNNSRWLNPLSDTRNSSLNWLIIKNSTQSSGRELSHLKKGSEKMQGIYLEQRVEQLEKEVRDLKEQKKNEQYLSPKEFAEKMSCSQSLITRMVRDGEIKALRIGKLIRIPMSQFEEKEGSEPSWKDIVFKGA